MAPVEVPIVDTLADLADLLGPSWAVLSPLSPFGTPCPSCPTSACAGCPVAAAAKQQQPPPAASSAPCSTTLRTPPPDRGVYWEGEPGHVRPDLVPLDIARERIAEEICRALLGGDHEPQITVLAAGTGAGKTETVMEEIRKFVDVDSETRILYSPPTIAEQIRVWASLRKRGVPAAKYVGRSSDPDSPGYCQRHEEIGMLGPKNRWAMPLACASCPFGLAAVAQIQEDRGQHKKAEQTRERISLEHPTAGEDVTPCRWILTNDAAKQAQVLIACHAAFTPSLAEGRRQIVDEEPEIVRWISVNPNGIHEWVDGLPAIEAGLRCDADKLERKIHNAEGQRAWEDGLTSILGNTAWGGFERCLRLYL